MWAELRAIATSLDGKRPDRLDYLQPDYFLDFAHYASRIIGDATLVRLTPRGRELLAGKAPLWLHPMARGFLHPECLHAALVSLKAVGRLGTGLPVGQLAKVLGKTHKLSRDEALMHIMWLAKYDLACFTSDEAVGSRRKDQCPAIIQNAFATSHRGGDKVSVTGDVPAPDVPNLG